jgi:hypothetical protein
MRTRLIVSITVTALALSACGGGNDNGKGPQAEVADMVIEALGESAGVEGVDVTVDEDCVRAATGKLSDSDAQAMIDAGPDGEADISAAGQAIGASLLECLAIGNINLDDINLDDLGG